MILGIDTSNYTTSVAAASEDDGITLDLRQVLPVQKGNRGLRQSDALFGHVKNLPHLIEQMSSHFPGNMIDAIGVSTAPRPQPESYMPVFRAGIGAARMLSAALDVPLYEYSHQEGHIRAALIGHETKRRQIGHDPFLAVHFSGGTSEIVTAQVNEKTAGYRCDIVGTSPDLHAGQLIDRIGVRLGLDFPAGKQMEALACQAVKKNIKFPSSLSNGNFHFSGLENAAAAALEEGESPAEVSFALFETIGRTLGRAVVRILDQHPMPAVVFSGGVMANRIICRTVEKRVRSNKRHNHTALIFADAHNATDNAQGIALMAREQFLKH